MPGANPFTTSFNADSTGLDQLLDLVAFHVDPGEETLTIMDKRGTGRPTTTDLDPATTTVALDAPQAAGIDTSGIATLVAAFNALPTPSNDATYQAAFNRLFDINFLEYGRTRVDFLNMIIAENPPSKPTFTEFAIDGCESATVCTIVGTLRDNGTPVEIAEMRVTLVDGRWLMSGNGWPFDADFSSVARSDNGIQAGFNLSVDLEQPHGRTAQSASIEFRDGNRSVFGPVQLVTSTEQGCSYLVTDVAMCGNFIPLNDTQVTTLNTAMRASAGPLDAVIQVTYTDNSTATHTITIRTPFFNQATASAAVNAARFSVTGLGTQTINFRGSNLEYLAVGPNMATFWGEDYLSRLNGRFTSPYPSALIRSVLMVSRDPLNRSIWFLQQQQTTP